MTDWYDEYYDDVVIDRNGIHVDALKKRGLFKKEFLTHKKKDHITQEEDNRAIQWMKDRVTEMEDTKGKHSCADCEYARYDDFTSKKGTFYCVLSEKLNRDDAKRSGDVYNIAEPLIVGATGEHDVVYRRWDECDGFCPKSECELCEYYDVRALTRSLADGRAVNILPQQMCAHYAYKDGLLCESGLSCAEKCKNFKYKEKEE